MLGGRLSDDMVYQPSDLRLGTFISVHGREFYLYDCDDFTRKYYRVGAGVCGEGLAKQSHQAWGEGAGCAKTEMRVKHDVTPSEEGVQRIHKPAHSHSRTYWLSTANLHAACRLLHTALRPDCCLQEVVGASDGEMAAIDVSEPTKPLPVPALPPWNGYGSPEDSLQNCIRLVGWA